MPRTTTSAAIGQPFSSNPDEPTIDFQVPTSPGFATGATISRQTARELIRELQRVLGEIDIMSR